MKSRKVSVKIEGKVHNEYVLPVSDATVIVYGRETWSLKKGSYQ